jgi:Na+/proline symporter
VDIACLVIFLVCIFYTSVGGMKAVMWTDTFQVRTPLVFDSPVSGFIFYTFNAGVHLLHLQLAAGAKVTQQCRFHQGEIDKNC